MYRDLNQVPLLITFKHKLLAMQSQTINFAPAWFRYGLVAVMTLMLCACKSTMPSGPAASNNAFEGQQVSHSQPRGYAPRNESQGYDSQIMPTIYRQSTNTPPPAVRMAQYAAGVRFDCPCGNHGSSSSAQACPSCQNCNSPGCNTSACGPQGCNGSCSIVGPRDEYLCDGGDAGLAVGIRKNWQVDGLEQEDTIAHYDTVDGRTVVTPSNQVCIYAPRFAVVRRMIDLREYARADAAGGFDSPLALSKIDENEKVATSLAQLEPTIHRTEDPATLMRERQQLGEMDRTMVIEEIDGSLSPYADLQIMHTGLFANGEEALVARASLAAITWAGDEAPQVTINERHAQASIRDSQPGEIYHLHDPKKPRLRLVKLASTGSAQPGDEVEFTLRFDNVGTQVIGNVTVMDNLTTRLEYVEGSAQSSVKAEFKAIPNGDGSAVVRWEITEPIEAGEGGILIFKCKVR